VVSRVTTRKVYGKRIEHMSDDSRADAVMCPVTHAIQRWVSGVVIELNLCPFAHAVVQRDLLHIRVAECADPAECLQLLADEAADLAVSSENDATTLLVLPTGFADFDAYLDLVALADALLVDLGYAGQLQIASFHPHYLFAEADVDDPANFTNRAPYACLHLLREQSVTSAVQRHPDPEGIPARNMDRMRALGSEKLSELIKGAQ